MKAEIKSLTHYQASNLYSEDSNFSSFASSLSTFSRVVGSSKAADFLEAY
jgi:hypothetical protein